MKKEIRTVDEKRGIVQITISDERWYLKPVPNKDTELPEYKEVPSVTWIASFYPKGIPFYKWLADKGWDESEAIKNAAGNRGSKVHLAIADILLGKEVRIDSKYPSKDSGQLEELTLEEIECIQSYINWYKELTEDNDVEPIAFEVPVFSDKYNYAGTVDFIVKLTNKKTSEISYWLIDFKTGQYIWTEYTLQCSAYRETIINGENGYPKLPPTADLKLAILQLGYRMNKKGYKFTELEPDFDMFLTAQKIWKKESGNQSPKKKDFQIVLSPAREETKPVDKPVV